MNAAALEDLATYAAACVDAELDDLLSRWHDWQHRSKVTRGFNDRSLVAGEYLTSRQYDDVSGVLDDDLDAMRSAQVDYEVSEMLFPWRTAIFLLARNLSTGLTVWMTPRLPTDPQELAEVVLEARRILTARLRKAGVMGD